MRRARPQKRMQPKVQPKVQKLDLKAETKKRLKTQRHFISTFSGGFSVKTVTSLLSHTGSSGGGILSQRVGTAVCPKCKYSLSTDEVNDGFLENEPYDYTTSCPDCDHRFETSAIFDSFGETQQFMWLCPKQTVEQCVHFANKNLFKTF